MTITVRQLKGLLRHYDDNDKVLLGTQTFGEYMTLDVASGRIKGHQDKDVVVLEGHLWLTGEEL